VVGLLVASVLSGLLQHPARATAASPSSSREAALLAEYQPVTYLFRQDWKPVSVETLLARADLERLSVSGWHVVARAPSVSALPAHTGGYRLDIRGCSPALNLDRCYRDPVAKAPQPAIVYGRDWINPDATAEIHEVLQYWFFSYLNDWRNSLTKPTAWQMHEGDWEVDSIALAADGTPLKVAYSQHDQGVVRPWADVPRTAQTHPIDYVALGSHANYFTIGHLGIRGRPHQIPPSFSGVPFAEPDFTSNQVAYGPAGLSPNTAAVVDVTSGANWLNFQGPWGDGNYIVAGTGTNPHAYLHLHAGDSPPGPAFQGTWQHPTNPFTSWPTDNNH
jgi:hypothetical protein